MERPKLIIEKKGHIVVLDDQWHKLMEGRRNLRIRQLEGKLNRLLKEQGKVNTEYEGYKKLKQQMMEEIVANMGDESEANNSAMARKSLYIRDINKKFDQYEKKKAELPDQIEEVNTQLLTESMMVLYKEMVSLKDRQKSLEQEIDDRREALNAMVARKKESDATITELYGFMHDVAGFEVIEQMDRHFFGGDT